MMFCRLRLAIASLACFLMAHGVGDATPALDHASVSLYAVNCVSGEVLIDQNSDLSLIPASCLKIVTTGAALHLLGPDMRFETYLEYDGFIDSDKTLQGNLFIRGGGDPCLGSDRIVGALSWKQQLEVWAEAVKKFGIQRIEGKVIGDAAKWERALAVPSWAWEDIGNYYGAGASALSFHENSYSLFFKPGTRIGAKANLVRTEPSIPHLTFCTEVTTGPEGSGDCACIYGSEFCSLRSVRGTIPSGVEEFAIKGSIPDPAFCCADLLAKQLQQNGIAIGQREISPQNKKVVLSITYSPTIGEIVHFTNQKSINLYAEHLLKKMGEVTNSEGSTESGIRAVTAFWKSQGIDLNGCNISDGSGLSRKNLVTTKQLVAMLLKMKEAPAFPIFFESLPEGEGGIRAKSGTMSLIKGYVGYSGNIAFALIVNNCADPRGMKEKVDALLLEVLCL